MSRFNLYNLFSLLFMIQLIINSSFVSTEESNKHMIELKINYIIIDSFCERQIEPDKSRCVTESVANWNSVDNRERAGCCISWDINDCILDAVYDKCDRITYNRIKRFLDQQNQEHSKGL